MLKYIICDVFFFFLLILKSCIVYKNVYMLGIDFFVKN